MSNPFASITPLHDISISAIKSFESKTDVFSDFEIGAVAGNNALVDRCELVRRDMLLGGYFVAIISGLDGV